MLFAYCLLYSTCVLIKINYVFCIKWQQLKWWWWTSCMSCSASSLFSAYWTHAALLVNSLLLRTFSISPIIYTAIPKSRAQSAFGNSPALSRVISQKTCESEEVKRKRSRVRHPCIGNEWLKRHDDSDSTWILISGERCNQPHRPSLINTHVTLDRLYSHSKHFNITFRLPIVGLFLNNTFSRVDLLLSLERTIDHIRYHVIRLNVTHSRSTIKDNK